jgi:hypothetical protein
MHCDCVVDLRDSVGLSAACGTICKHCSIISVHDAVQQVLRCRFVNISLCGGLIKDPIECERLVLYSFALRSHKGFREFMDRIVFWGIEYSAAVLAFHASICKTNGPTSTCRQLF